MKTPFKNAMLLLLLAIMSISLLNCTVSTIPDVTEVSQEIPINSSKSATVTLHNDTDETVFLLEETVPEWIEIGGLREAQLNPNQTANVNLTAKCGPVLDYLNAMIWMKSASGNVSKAIDVSIACIDPKNPVPNEPPPPPPSSPAPTTGGSPIGPQKIPGDGKDGRFYVSPNGSDSNPGSISKPFKTITKAARSAKPGEIIYLRGGTYPRTKISDVNGRPGQPITFRAFPGERPIIDSSMRKNKGNVNEGIALWIFQNASWLVFDGLEITDTNPDIETIRAKYDMSDPKSAAAFERDWVSDLRETFPFGVRLNINSKLPGGDINNIVFRNMRIHHILNLAFSIQDVARNITIEYSHLYDLGYPRSGYGVYTHNQGFIFRNNIVHDAVYGLHLYSKSTLLKDVLIENNHIYNIGNHDYWHMDSNRVKFGGRAIFVDGDGEDVIIRNNIVRNSRNGIAVNTTDTVVEHNLVYDGQNGYAIGAPRVELVNNIAHSLQGEYWYGTDKPSVDRNNSQVVVRLVDPARVEKGITNASAVKDRGAKTGTQKDILGVARPKGAAPDIGPFEVQ